MTETKEAMVGLLQMFSIEHRDSLKHAKGTLQMHRMQMAYMKKVMELNGITREDLMSLNLMSLMILLEDDDRDDRDNLFETIREFRANLPTGALVSDFDSIMRRTFESFGDTDAIVAYEQHG